MSVSSRFQIKLTKEEEMTKTNTHKLNDRWRTIMRELKAKELAGEIEVCRPHTVGMNSL